MKLSRIKIYNYWNEKNTYSEVCGTAVGVKMCDDKALGGAIGSELWCFCK